MKRRFRIYEIEHQGDECEALSELSRIGCLDIEVISRDYIRCECEESIAVQCVVPPHVKLEEADLCL